MVDSEHALRELLKGTFLAQAPIATITVADTGETAFALDGGSRAREAWTLLRSCVARTERWPVLADLFANKTDPWGVPVRQADLFTRHAFSQATVARSAPTRATTRRIVCVHWTSAPSQLPTNYCGNRPFSSASAPPNRPVCRAVGGGGSPGNLPQGRTHAPAITVRPVQSVACNNQRLTRQQRPSYRTATGEFRSQLTTVMGAARNGIEPLMTRLLQAVGFLMLAARSGALFAIFGPPVLSPAAPTSADVISMETRASGCHLFEGGPNDAVVTTEGTTITIVVRARINAFCNFPTTTRSYVVGRFPPGVYTLKAFYLPGPLSGGGPPRLMGLRPVTVTPQGGAIAVPIPSLTAFAAALLAALCTVVAAVEQRRRRSRTPGAPGPLAVVDRPET